MRAREGDIAEAAQAIALALQAAKEIGDGVERAQAFVDIAGVQLCAIEGGAHWRRSGRGTGMRGTRTAGPCACGMNS